MGLWLMTYGGGPSGGYIIDYSSTPRVVSRWHRRLGQDDVYTPLPHGVRLLYTNRQDMTPEGHVREFTVAQVEAMNLHELDYMYAAAWYEDIWEDFPGQSPDAPSVTRFLGPALRGTNLAGRGGYGYNHHH